MLCQNCGKEVDGNFCTNCGAPVGHSPNSAPMSKTNISKPFKIFSILSSVFCIFSLLTYIVSAFLTSIPDFLTALHISSIILFFVMSVIIATQIQSSNQLISSLFYAFSCIGLLFIAFTGFIYSLFTLVICILSVALVVTTAILGRKSKTNNNISKKNIIVSASVLIIISIFLFVCARVATNQRNARLSNVTINNISLSREQLDIIDEDWFLRYIMHNELTYDKLNKFNYKYSENQSDIIDGTEYYTSDYPECDILQIDTSSLSYNLGTATSYSITYIPVKLDSIELKEIIDVYSDLLGDDFKNNDETYTFEQILSAQIPNDDTISYISCTSPDDEISIHLNLTVNKNGYAVIDVVYLF